MPAGNAASPGVNGDATQSNASNGAPAQAAEDFDRGDGAAASSDVAEVSSETATPGFNAKVAAQLGLPADITERLRKDAAARNGVAAGEQQEVVGESAETADATTTSEEEHEDEHESAGSDVFKDPRVQKRLAKAARQRDRLVDIALDGLGATEDEIDAVKSSKDPIAEAAALKGELMQRVSAQQQQQVHVPQGPQAPATKGLLGHVTNEASLTATEDHALAQMEWCDANADGTTVGEGSAARFVEPSEIAKYRKEMEKILLQAPRRRQEIRDAVGQRMQAVQRYDTIAREEAPDLWDPKSEGSKQLAQIGQEDEVIQGFMRRNPDIANDPAINVLLTRYVQGYLARGNKSAQPLNPDLPPSLIRKHPPLAPVTAGPPSRSAAPNGTKRVAEAMQHLAEDGSPQALTAAIRARREAGGTRRNGAHELAAV
jgi:hypothetical protein